MSVNDTTRDQLEADYKALSRSERLATAGRFAGQTMHEINNPLEALGNLVYLAKMDRMDPDKVKLYLCMAEEQLQHVQEIARRTLTFYRSADSPQPVDLVFVVESALRMHAPRLARKGIDVRRELPETAYLSGDPGELLQVFSNLITNAVSALSNRGRLHIRITQSNHHLHALIADNGKGIPDSVSRRLFQPFSTQGKADGTGLGLWITKTLVEKHRGRIRHRSTTRPGRSGTAFRVSLRALDLAC